MGFVDIHVIQTDGIPRNQMIKQLMYKWFGLTDDPCESCEILRMQLAESNAERKDLLHRLLDPKQAEPPSIQSDEPVAITPQYVPWRVKQQMLEAEDRQKAKLIRDRTKEIADLEREVGIS
jgi:hypothetical protein